MMTPTEAIALLTDPDFDESAESRMNSSFTQGRMREVILAGVKEILAKRGDRPLDHIMEKRVWQVIRNQINPRF